MSSQSKIYAIGAIIVMAFIAVVLLTQNMAQPLSVSEYISDGGSLTYTVKGYGSRLNVALTSTNDYMYVKIVVDGQSVYDKNNIYDVNYKYNMGFGYHIINIILQNPTLFGLGSRIQVSGIVSVDLF
jgi:hypothetical protein